MLSQIANVQDEAPVGVSASLTTASRCGSTTGSERSSSALMSEKMAVLAPMPSASDKAATIETMGVARSERTARRTSCMTGSVPGAD